MNDSISTYSKNHQPFIPFTQSGQWNAPLDSTAILQSTTVIDTWNLGMTPCNRPEEHQPASGIVALLIALMAIIAFESQQLRHILSNLDTDLLGVRRRVNAFDSHTASESRTIGVLILLSCVVQAIILAVFTGGNQTVSDFPLLCKFIALTIGYYFFQWCAYRVVGFAFTDNINTVQWLKGFNLQQAILGLALLLPAIFVLYYHQASVIPVFVAIFLYIVARITFLCKGFRIFYNGLPSLVYFILYLCALEIIPVILVIKTAYLLETQFLPV